MKSQPAVSYKKWQITGVEKVIWIKGRSTNKKKSQMEKGDAKRWKKPWDTVGQMLYTENMAACIISRGTESLENPRSCASLVKYNNFHNK